MERSSFNPFFQDPIPERKRDYGGFGMKLISLHIRELGADSNFHDFKSAPPNCENICYKALLVLTYGKEEI